MFSSLGFRKLTNGLSFTSRVVNLTIKTQPQVQTLKLSHTFRKPVYNTQAGRRPLFKRQEPESELADLNRIIPKKPRPAKKQAIKEEAKPKIKKRIEKKKEVPVEETRLVPIRVDEVAKKQAKRVEALGEDVSNRRKLRLIKPPVQLEDYITRLNLGVVKTGRFSQKSRAEYESRVMMPVLQFFAGAKDPASFPPESLPEVAFVGRSNVGKSSLINVLADSTAVRVSSKPGLTQQINFFTADDEFHIVDMPGYGFAYAKEEMRESWKNLIETYIAKRRTMKRLYILVDSRHGVKYIDKQFMEMVDS
ncbi:hypothetical protein K7432_009052 [Basidiobolus ranarum]|uniref:EngB-type G domain-containing protein n=1 Tax=Basidiobolus ranarum TaxID=34480 RepID=A0ABR2VXM9_9FUNG